MEFSRAQIRCQLKLKSAAPILLHSTPSYLFLFIQVGSYASLPAPVTSEAVSWLWCNYSKLKCRISIKQHLLCRRESMVILKTPEPKPDILWVLKQDRHSAGEDTVPLLTWREKDAALFPPIQPYCTFWVRRHNSSLTFSIRIGLTYKTGLEGVSKGQLVQQHPHLTAQN